MLSVSDYNHLMLLYDKFFKSNQHIKNLISESDWDSVDIAIQEKESLIRQILFFEKPRVEEIKSNKELLGLRKKLIELEKENIVLVQTMRSQLVGEISNVKKAKKILNTYEPSTYKIVSTFELRDEE